ncbi:cellulose biosynthesis protein BcsP [Caballeronia sp. LjRoot34]|uniref:cellulose biosynthesis protein BcsP n=1 Tax=Caballeronia sp. LjRoot34 TaxID=3342325 RepID=UPI003ECC5ADE
MNPSRDIKKLFDRFGGDAGNYQEIGRENEAIHARTRWPLLATLDLSQPSIPNIAPRRDAHLPHTHDRSGEHRNVPNSLTQPTGAAPLNRGKPPLFARAHRKTVPPVANVTLPATPVGAARFSALVDAVEETSNAVETEAVPSADAQPQQQARLPQPLFRPFHTQQEQLPQQAQHPQPQPRTLPLATPAPASASAQLTGFAAALQRSNTAARSLSLPRVQAPEAASTPAPASALALEPKSQSILGKLFRPQAHAQPAPQASAPPDSLASMFQRLRGPVAEAPAAVNSGAGSWLAKNHSQS